MRKTPLAIALALAMAPALVSAAVVVRSGPVTTSTASVAVGGVGTTPPATTTTSSGSGTTSSGSGTTTTGTTGTGTTSTGTTGTGTTTTGSTTTGTTTTGSTTPSNPFLGAPMPLQNTATADARAATTNQVTQPMRSSGLTSENTVGTGVSSSTTSGGTGVASGNLTAAQATGQAGEAVGAGVPIGSGDTTGSSSVNGSGTGSTATNGFVNPVITGTLGATAEGDQLLFDANGNPVGTSGSLGMASTVNTGPVVVNNGIAAADYVAADRAMNQVIHDSRVERKRVGRNGQLLYSIAPRTNVDRSKEMPDDGPLAFSGPIR